MHYSKQSPTTTTLYILVYIGLIFVSIMPCSVNAVPLNAVATVEIKDGRLVTAAASSSTSKSTSSSSSSSSNEEKCIPIDSCTDCTKGDTVETPVCTETGKRQRFECKKLSEDNQEEKVLEWRSCKKTKSEEEFAMIQLQVFCLLIGSVAFASVKRQRVVSASLFEQRKHGAQQKPRSRRRSDYEEEMIEFTQIVQGGEDDNNSNEESIPLVDTSNNPLEVV